MANKNKTEEQFAHVEEALSKTEQYIFDNQKSLLTILVAIVGLIALFSVYQNFYIAPLEKEAQTEMYLAELAFQKDSFELALNGADLQFLGFVDISSDYSSTKAGMLANYYAGLCYLNLADYNNAIDFFGSFSSDDIILSSLASGCTGDAYLELGDTENALKSYKDATSSNNSFTSPKYLMKMAMVHEMNEDYSSSLEIYNKIKSDYIDSREAKTIEKFIARAKSR
jgi:tetratricopeptide (TPR) repeat protein